MFLIDELTLFPRNVGMGTSTTAARIGSFLSPYVVYSVSNSNAKEIYQFAVVCNLSLAAVHVILRNQMLGISSLLCF